VPKSANTISDAVIAGALLRLIPGWRHHIELPNKSYMEAAPLDVPETRYGDLKEMVGFSRAEEKGPSMLFKIRETGVVQ
jgi:hypothetical protein